MYYHHIVRELFGTLLLLLPQLFGQDKEHLYVNSQLMYWTGGGLIAEYLWMEISVEKLSYLLPCQHVATPAAVQAGAGLVAAGLYSDCADRDRALRAVPYNPDYSITDIAGGVSVLVQLQPSSWRIFTVFRPSQWQKIRSDENPIVTAYFNFRCCPPIWQFFPTEYHDFTE